MNEFLTNPTVAVAVLLLVFAFGEYVAYKTKAMISTALVVAIVLLAGYWTFLPSTLIKSSAVESMGFAIISAFIVAMGTMMNFKELKEQWKTVIISICGLILAVILIIYLGGLIIGERLALVGAPIYAGGNVASLIMIGKLTSINLDNLAPFVILVLVTQGFIGIPVSSFFLRKEAHRFVKTDEFKNYSNIQEEVEIIDDKRKLINLPKSLDRPSTVLAKLALTGALSYYTSTMLKKAGIDIHYLVLSLILGAVLSELGFLEKHSLKKTESAAFIIFATTIVVFGKLHEATLEMLTEMLIPLLVVLIIGTIGVVISGLIVSKILKVSPWLAITLGLTCTYGFPTTMLMSKEVAVAVGKDQKEVEILENYLMPKMVTAGFVTVTIASVLVAGQVIKYIS